MIQLFRKIRRKLIDEGNLKKYVLYAFGEIILVVLGILMALQVNNWSAQAKERAEEKKTLIELKEGFQSDLDDLQFNQILLEAASQSCAVLIHHMENDLPYHDSLQTHFSNSIIQTRFISNSGPYESLKGKGIELIKKDTLRNQIIKMHDFYFETVKTFESGESLPDHHLINFCIDHFEEIQMVTLDQKGQLTGGKMVPLDYPALMKNIKYKTLLRSTESQNAVFAKSRLNNICQKLGALIQKIEQEVR